MTDRPDGWPATISGPSRAHCGCTHHWDDDAGEDDQPDPDEVERQTKIEDAQRLRDAGLPIETNAADDPDIVTAVGMSQSWISKHTDA